MSDISKIKLNGQIYEVKDEVARAGNPAAAAINTDGLITVKNSSNTALYSVQLPLFNETTIDDGAVLYQTKNNLVTINLPVSWTAGAGVYTQVFTIPALGQDTENKKIDLIQTPELVNQLETDGVKMLFINNNNGVLTAVAINNAPSAALTIQALVSEVFTE